MKNICLSIVLLLLISSCAESYNEVQEKELIEYDAPTVELNQGVQWQANAATVEGISKLKILAENFDTESDSFEELQSQMRNEFSLIFKNCTMKGEAHEQLHNYLLPLMDMFGDLTTSNKDAALKAIKKHLDKFDGYFEQEG